MNDEEIKAQRGSAINLVMMGNFLYPRGMAETKRIQHVIDQFKATGNRSVHVILLRQSHVGRDDARLTGVHEGTPFVTLGHDLQPDWRFPFALAKYLVSGFANLLRVRKRGATNILYLYMEPNTENALLVAFAKILGFRIVVDVTEDYYMLGEHPHLLSRLKASSTQFFSRHIGLFANAMIVISVRLKDKYEKIARGAFPVFLMPPVANLDRIVCIEREFSSPVRILYSGSFAQKDAVDLLIAAFEIAARQHTNTTLVLTGKGMPELVRPIQERIAASPAKDKITYLGYLGDDEFYRVLSGADILCMVRRDSAYANAGFPFKLVEYLATGRPVIASRVGDIPDFLTDRHNAMLVEPDSIDSIAAAMSYLISHPRVAVAIGAGGRQVAEQSFSRNLVGARLMGFLEQL